MAQKPTGKIPEKQDPETTGHEWDGIKEFNNPMPGWWLKTMYLCIIWAIGYTIAYPAWPLIKGATPGLLGWSTRGDVAAEIKRFDDLNLDLNAELATADLTALEIGSPLHNYAIQSGRATFANYCSQCHGSGAAGAEGYPNLLDDEWLWGGDVEAIQTTVTYGIRAPHDDTRLGDMPGWGDMLEEEELAQVIEFVMTLSDEPADAMLAEAGAMVFEDNCSGCHGETGAGDRDLGAPNLTNGLWLFGPDKASITESIVNGRKGEMPNWNDKLTVSQINAVTVYVHTRGGGE